jgi:hypothetical protein
MREQTEAVDQHSLISNLVLDAEGHFILFYFELHGLSVEANTKRRCPLSLDFELELFEPGINTVYVYGGR